MVALPCGELEHGGDVVRLEIGVIGKNLSPIRAGRQEIQDVFHTNAHATDGRPSGTDVWIDSNAVDLGHGCLLVPMLHLSSPWRESGVVPRRPTVRPARERRDPCRRLWRPQISRVLPHVLATENFMEKQTLEQRQAVLDAVSRDLTPRVEELAQKSTEALLTPEDHKEYAEVVRLNDS